MTTGACNIPVIQVSFMSSELKTRSFFFFSIRILLHKLLYVGIALGMTEAKRQACLVLISLYYMHVT